MQHDSWQLSSLYDEEQIPSRWQHHIHASVALDGAEQDAQGVSALHFFLHHSNVSLNKIQQKQHKLAKHKKLESYTGVQLHYHSMSTK